MTQRTPLIWLRRIENVYSVFYLNLFTTYAIRMREKKQLTSEISQTGP